MNPATSVLSGAELDAFVDQVIALARGDFDDASPSAVFDDALQAAQQRASQVLASRAMQPSDFESLERLFHVWHWLGDPDRANQVLDAHEGTVLNSLPPDDRPLAQAKLALLRLDHLPDSAADSDLRSAGLLRQATDALSALPPAIALSHVAEWHGLLTRARQAKLADVYAHSAAALHALQQQQATRQAWRCYDDANAKLRLATAQSWRGEQTQANAVAHAVMQQLANHPADQEITADDWVQLGRPLLSLAPELTPEVLKHAQAALEEPHSPARKRDLAVQLARLQAQVLWEQGQREAALKQAQAGLFILSRDEDDDFGAQVIDWYMQAGQEEQAAELALECSWGERSPSTTMGVNASLQQLALDSPHAGTWDLVLCAAALANNLPSETLAALGFESNTAALASLLTRARSRLPDHPLVDVIEGLCMERDERFAEALPKLERATELPHLCNAELGYVVWRTRLRLLGTAGLDRPFIETGAGAWCYNMGVMLSDPDEVLEQSGYAPDDRAQFDKKSIQNLSLRYYERAMVYFEGFFATGEGNRRDSDIHCYAMNCNNLAIQYRCTLERHDDALVVHQKGIAASPFAEHHDGVMTCLWLLDRHEEYLRAAEELWQYAMAHGYSRHDPTDYFGNIAWTLHHLNRHSEIEVWIDRLHQWQRDMDPDWRESQLGDLLSCEASLQAFLANTQSPDPVARLRVLQSLLAERKEVWGLNRVGHGFYNAGQMAEALAVHELAAKLYDPELHDESLLTTAQEGIASCSEALQPAKKPFWRRWF